MINQITNTVKKRDVSVHAEIVKERERINLDCEKCDKKFNDDLDGLLDKTLHDIIRHGPEIELTPGDIINSKRIMGLIQC